MCFTDAVRLLYFIEAYAPLFSPFKVLEILLMCQINIQIKRAPIMGLSRVANVFPFNQVDWDIIAYTALLGRVPVPSLTASCRAVDVGITYIPLIYLFVSFFYIILSVWQACGRARHTSCQSAWQKSRIRISQMRPIFLLILVFSFCFAFLFRLIILLGGLRKLPPLDDQFIRGNPAITDLERAVLQPAGENHVHSSL